MVSLNTSRGCYALWKFKIEMDVAGSIFELQPSNLGKFIFFKDVLMIEKSFFDIFNGIKVAKNQVWQPIQYYQVPRLGAFIIYVNT